jgi:hypothetical protein
MKKKQTNFTPIETRSGQSKGEIYRTMGSWWWYRPNGGLDRFPRRLLKDDVLEEISHVCREEVVPAKK